MRQLFAEYDELMCSLTKDLYDQGNELMYETDGEACLSCFTKNYIEERRTMLMSKVLSMGKHNPILMQEILNDFLRQTRVMLVVADELSTMNYQLFFEDAEPDGDSHD